MSEHRFHKLKQGTARDEVVLRAFENAQNRIRRAQEQQSLLYAQYPQLWEQFDHIRRPDVFPAKEAT